MKSKQELKEFLKDVLYYMQGNIRHFFYYSWLQFLLRKHIREQISLRIAIMDISCLRNGHCLKCGCKTPHLQMANKTCEGNCYPTMMNKKDWKKFSENKNIYEWKSTLKKTNSIVK